jgi:hypothetical protein
LRFLRDDNFGDEVGGYGYGKLAVFLPRIWLISADFNGFYLVRLTAKGFLRDDNFGDEVGGYGYGKLAVFLPRIWLISADFNGFYLVRLTAKGFLRNDNFVDVNIIIKNQLV